MIPEQEDDDDDNQQGFNQSVQNFVDGVLNVFRRVIRNAQRHARGQLRLNGGQLFAHILDYFRELAVGSTQIPMKVAVCPLKRTSES